MINRHFPKRERRSVQVCSVLLAIEDMQMKAKTEVKNTIKKKTATKTVTPPKTLPAGLHKKLGVWVFSTGQSGQPITAAQLERLRQSMYRERENRWMGNLAESEAKKASENWELGTGNWELLLTPWMSQSFHS